MAMKRGAGGASPIAAAKANIFAALEGGTKPTGVREKQSYAQGANPGMAAVQPGRAPVKGRPEYNPGIMPKPTGPRVRDDMGMPARKPKANQDAAQRTRVRDAKAVQSKLAMANKQRQATKAGKTPGNPNVMVQAPQTGAKRQPNTKFPTKPDGGTKDIYKVGMNPAYDKGMAAAGYAKRGQMKTQPIGKAIPAAKGMKAKADKTEAKFPDNKFPPKTKKGRK